MQEETPSAWRQVMSHPAVRMLAWMSGLGLLLLAMWMIVRDPAMSQETFARLRDGLGRLTVVQVITLLLLPLCSLLLTSLCFWQLMRMHGGVRLIEMWNLIAASWVLNLLPLKPGLVGRVVYHAKVNRIPAATSVRVLVEAAVSGILGVAMLSAIVLRQRVGEAWFDGLLGAASLTLLALALWGIVRPAQYVPRIAGAVLLRLLDAFTWVLRYGLVFRIVGVDLPIEHAAIIAAGAQAAAYVPLVGNGLGVREWVVGSLSRWMSAANVPIQIGLAADVLNRLIEVLVLGPVGLLGVWWVTRRVREAHVGKGVEPASGAESPG